jgi:hypothetical protein
LIVTSSTNAALLGKRFARSGGADISGIGGP